MKLPLPSLLQGKLKTRPIGTPYSPRETVQALTQSPDGVGASQFLTWSMAPLAADRAELAPRALMTAAPRFWTCGTKVFSNQVRSVITSGARRPLISALVKSGYCVLEWL